jgi:hypothetical protein
VDDFELGDHLYELERFLHRQEPFAIIFQLTGDGWFRLDQSERVRRHVLSHRSLTEQYLLGIALVPHTRLQHVVLKGFLWFAHPPCPMRLCDNLSSALDWAHQRTAHPMLVLG